MIRIWLRLVDRTSETSRSSIAGAKARFSEIPYTALKRRPSTVVQAGVSSQQWFNVSSFAPNLCPPPADADEEESPVAEEFWRLAFEGMTDELENPSRDK
jgi:hypothetical protein